MEQLYPRSADFEAIIRIYSFEEGGRMRAAQNGIRWDFAYADWPEEELLELSAIWPDFVDEEGNSINVYQPLTVGIELPARMFIVWDQMRDFHRERIAIGTRFYCHEGARRVAVGQVTKITGLANQQQLSK